VVVSAGVQRMVIDAGAAEACAGDMKGLLESKTPDPFAGYDGMGGMTKESASEGPSVFGEVSNMQDSLKNFKPSMPQSITSPETAGFGALPTPPIPTSSFTPQRPPQRPAGGWQSVDPERGATAAPDPLKDGGWSQEPPAVSGISYGNGEGMTEEQQEEEAKREEEAKEKAEKIKEEKEAAAKAAEEKKEEQVERREAAVDAKYGRLDIPRAQVSCTCACVGMLGASWCGRCNDVVAVLRWIGVA
jgi:hypothetical protein